MTNTNTNNKIQLGLVAGRHPLPVDDFIISGDIADVLDFDLIDKLVKEGLEKVPTKPMISVIGSLDGDVRVEVNCLQCDVDIFVTGLTAVTIAVVNHFKDLDLNGHTVRFMHFDRDSGTFKPQVLK